MFCDTKPSTVTITQAILSCGRLVCLTRSGGLRVVPNVGVRRKDFAPLFAAPEGGMCGKNGCDTPSLKVCRRYANRLLRKQTQRLRLSDTAFRLTWLGVVASTSRNARTPHGAPISNARNLSPA